MASSTHLVAKPSADGKHVMLDVLCAEDLPEICASNNVCFNDDTNVLERLTPAAELRVTSSMTNHTYIIDMSAFPLKARTEPLWRCTHPMPH